MNLTPYLPYIYVGLGGVVLVLLVYLIYRILIRNTEDRWREEFEATDQSGILDEADLILPKQNEGFFSNLDDGFETLVARTGLDLSSEEALSLMSFCSVVFGGGLFLWKEQIWLAMIGFAVGLVIPLVVFLVLQGRYQRKLQAQLADVYFLLARSIRAGLTLEQSIKVASEQNLDPISEEFKRCSLFTDMGLTVPAALKSMAKRINLLDFDTFVSLVAYHHSIGGNLPLQLDRLAANTRDRNEFRGHLSAATAQARATAFLIGLGGPLALLAYAIFQPEYAVPFFASPGGWMLLAGCLVVEVVAALILYRMLKVDY